jgi:rfaE bifunctional protein nucleotidyltransferase chain/domain
MTPRKIVVFTTGVFDVPHVGHPRYLAEAKKFGDILIVGVHSDKLVKLRKGENRPIFPAYERMEFLSYFSSVDYILELKDQKEIYDTITQLRPQVLVVSETTEDFDNNPQTMRTLFSGYSNIEVLGAQSSIHSTDFVKAMNKVQILK